MLFGREGFLEPLDGMTTDLGQSEAHQISKECTLIVKDFK